MLFRSELRLAVQRRTLHLHQHVDRHALRMHRVVNYAKTTFTSGILAPYWLFMLGGLFIAVTLLLPKGIVGTLQQWWNGRSKPGAKIL